MSSPAELHAHFENAGVPLSLQPGQSALPLPRLLAALRTTLRFSARTQAPLFFNQLSARADPAAIVGDWVAAAAHAPVHTFEVAPTFTQIEHEVLARMARAVGGRFAPAAADEGKPAGRAGAEGLFVPGGSIANLYGLLLALHNKVPDFREEGVAGRGPFAVFCSAQAHFSLAKSVLLLGLGRRALIPVPCDHSGAMLVSAERNAPWVADGRRGRSGPGWAVD